MYSLCGTGFIVIDCEGKFDLSILSKKKDIALTGKLYDCIEKDPI